MKPLIIPAIVSIFAIAAFIFWPDKTPPECISKGTTTALPWLECKK